MEPYTFFVSYRREDTAPIALLLKSEIEKRLQFVRVSVDVEEIELGEEFPDRLRNLIDRSRATIALIGKHWMPSAGSGPSGAHGKDWVAEELLYSRNAPVVDRKPTDRESLQREIIPIFIDCEPKFSRFNLPDSLAFLRTLHGEQINYATWPSSIGPLLDRIAKKVCVQIRATTDEFPKPDPSKARTQPVDDAELAKTLQFDDFEGWYVDNFGHAAARYLCKTFEFEHFGQAAEFMTIVSNHCRVLDHHPEWRNVYRRVTVSLTTWDAKRRVTIYDLNLALFMNMAAQSVSKRGDAQG